MTQPSELGGTIRDTSDAISPSWWNGPNGKRVRYAMSVPLDALLDSFAYAIYMGLAAYGTAPGVNTQGSLRWIGNDRQIQQGFQESTASYRARLLQWLIRHSYRGKATGVLMAARGWILPQMPLMYSIKDSPGNNPWLAGSGSVTTWTSYADGQDPMPAGATTVTPPTRSLSSPRNFNWDGNYPAPFVDASGRVHFLHRAFFVIFSAGTSWVTASGTWGSSGKFWGDLTKCWGFQTPIQTITGLRSLIAQWQSGGTWYQWIIVSFDATLFDQARAADGTHNPAGTFGRWSKIVNGQYVSARFANARYANGPSWPGGT